MNVEYAVKDGYLTHISEVERGLKCGCVCPGCGGKMVARKGEMKSHHFAHQGAVCAFGVETTLHMMAKSILAQEKKILLPAVSLPFIRNREHIVSETKLVEFDEVLLEQRLGDVIPDVLIRVGDRYLMIEIWVTHKIDDNKKKKIVASGISTLEIDLSRLGHMISKDELQETLIAKVDSKNWVYNQVADKYMQAWLAICDTKKIIQRGYAWHVDQCPINARIWHGKSYANVMDDCSSCEYCLKIGSDHNAYDENLLFCFGKTGVKTVSDLRRYRKEMEMK